MPSKIRKILLSTPQEELLKSIAGVGAPCLKQPRHVGTGREFWSIGFRRCHATALALIKRGMVREVPRTLTDDIEIWMLRPTDLGWEYLHILELCENIERKLPCQAAPSK